MVRFFQARALGGCALAGALAFGACGSDAGTSVATLPPPTSISIMVESGDAGRLLSEIYAQALEAQGFRWRGVMLLRTLQRH